jgi:hypothetical protein
MDLCIISPVAGLERYATLSKKHLVLAQIEDERYERFYQQRSILGDHIILDNGAYESGQVDMENYLDKAAYYIPKQIVLLDHPNQPGRRTFSLSIHFSYCLVESLNSTYADMMAAPQGINTNDLYHWLDIFLSIIDIKAIGISKLLQSIDKRIVYRLQIAEYIKSYRPSIYIHALGMWDGDLEEYNLLKNSGLIDSLDTSAAVWRGLMNCRLDDPKDQAYWATNGIPVDFSYSKPISDSQHTIICHNLEVLGVDTSSIK